MAKKRTFTCGSNAGNPKWAKWAHLARLGNQLECKVLLILPTRGSSWTFFVFSMEVVFQDNHLQNLTKHKAQ